MVIPSIDIYNAIYYNEYNKKHKTLTWEVEYMSKDYQIRELLTNHKISSVINREFQVLTVELQKSRTKEITVNDTVVYLYDDTVVMTGLDRSKSQHGYPDNSYKVKGKKRPYIVAQKEKFYLDELEIVGHKPAEIIVCESGKQMKYIIGEKTIFKQR